MMKLVRLKPSVRAFLIGWAGITLATVNCMGLAREDILFYAPFDGTRDAQIAHGSDKAVGGGSASFVPGVRGQAIMVGGPDSDIKYTTAGNLELRAGTVALWLKPLDWSTGKTGDSYMRFFFRMQSATEGSNFAWLYKYFQNSVYWLAQRDVPQRTVTLVCPATGDAGGLIPFDWEVGKWAHLVACWADNQMSLYINGQYAGSAYAPKDLLLADLAPEFIIGGANGRDKGTPDTVIDEVIILRKPLSPNEAAAVYARGIEAFQKPVAAAPRFTVSAGINPVIDTIALTAELVGIHPDDLRRLSVACDVAEMGTNRPVLKKTLALTSVRQITPVDVPGLLPGKYVLRAQLLTDDGRMLSQAVCEFERQTKPEWAGNSVGRSETELPGFSPIVVESKTVSCWGRSYAWDTGLLPSQVTTQDEALLARPISLSATVNGKNTVLEEVLLTWDKGSPTRVGFSGTARFGQVPVALRGWLEYDGFAWFEIIIGGDRSPADAVLGSLVLEIPFRPAMATLMVGGQSGVVPESGAVRPFSGDLYGGPVVWIGNETGGLQWCAEEFKNWNVANHNTMVSLRQDAGETVLRFNLVDCATPLLKPLQYAFGLQATPVKAIPRGHREWEMRLNGVNCSPSNQRKAWAYFRPDWNATEAQPGGRGGYMVATPATYRMAETYAAMNQAPWLYWNMHILWGGDPVLRMFPDWGEYRDPATTSSWTGARLDHGNPLQRDYTLWCLWQLMKDDKIAPGYVGFYSDTTEAGWDGGIYTVRGTRDLQKRFYTMLKTTRPEYLVANHQSGDLDMFQLAFVDMMVTGEHLTMHPGIMKDKSYCNVLTLDGMRAEYYGANFGIPMVFLPELVRSHGDGAVQAQIKGPAGIPAAEHLTGMLWVHDIVPWHTDVNAAPLRQAALAKDAFGWDADTRFVGYWQNRKFITVTADQNPVVTSVFLRKDKVLFMTMNNSDADATVTLTPDWPALGIDPATELVDVYAEQATPPQKVTTPIRDRKAAFTVRARNFRAWVAR